MSLVAVVLFDFQDRRFLPRQRCGKEEIIQEVRDVENYLLRYTRVHKNTNKGRKEKRGRKNPLTQLVVVI